MGVRSGPVRCRAKLAARDPPLGRQPRRDEPLQQGWNVRPLRIENCLMPASGGEAWADLEQASHSLPGLRFLSQTMQRQGLQDVGHDPGRTPGDDLLVHRQSFLITLEQDEGFDQAMSLSLLKFVGQASLVDEAMPPS